MLVFLLVLIAITVIKVLIDFINYLWLGELKQIKCCNKKSLPTMYFFWNIVSKCSMKLEIKYDLLEICKSPIQYL